MQNYAKKKKMKNKMDLVIFIVKLHFKKYSIYNPMCRDWAIIKFAQCQLLDGCFVLWFGKTTTGCLLLLLTNSNTVERLYFSKLI